MTLTIVELKEQVASVTFECIELGLLRESGLLPEPEDAGVRLARALAGQISSGERALLATREGMEAPLTLALGECLGASTRAGAVLARLLAAGDGPPWVIVGARIGGQPQIRECDAADRIMAAAQLVDIPLLGVYLNVPLLGIYLLRGGKVDLLAKRE